jgi:hypothetical protein
MAQQLGEYDDAEGQYRVTQIQNVATRQWQH